jgi:hypothetical protein
MILNHIKWLSIRLDAMKNAGKELPLKQGQQVQPLIPRPFQEAVVEVETIYIDSRS